MRELIAGLAAIFLLFVALVLVAALRRYRIRREEVVSHEVSRGRRVVAELPVGPEIVLFTEGRDHFHYGEQRIDKRSIQAVRVLINGSPIAAYVSPRFPSAAHAQPTSFEDRPEGIARDRWDVAIEATDGTVLVECGAIRERISQEFGRKIFDAVKEALEARDRETGGWSLEAPG